MKRFYSWGLVALLGLAWPQPTQAQIVGKSVPAFTTAAGTLIRPGDTLHLGRLASAAGHWPRMGSCYRLTQSC